ncbi:hypothetical protein MNV49_002708 [Pseudohyphozyma bogoriensis]|nr:hypothetical protein MNV49_002708 [Pseudohyphozyma bogoriensis]
MAPSRRLNSVHRPADLLLSSSPSSCGTNSPPSSPSTSARLPPVPPTWRVELHYSYEGESWVCQDSTCVNIRASSARPFGAYKSTNGGTSSIRKRAWEHWYSKHLQDELDVVGPIVLSRETSPSTTAPDSPTENTFTPDLQTLDLPVTPFTTSQELDEPFVFDDPTAMDFDQLQLPDFTLYPYDPPPGGTTYFADFSQGLFFRK